MRNALLPATAMMLAGWTHLAITPLHFFHAEAHGVFFALSGLLQVLWVPLFLILRKQGWVRLLGYALSGGMVVVWILTRAVDTPYANGPEPIDSSLMICKAAELVCLVSITTQSTATWPKLRRPCGISVGFGCSIWLLAILSEANLPNLFSTTEGHGSHAHTHGDEQSHYSWADVYRAVEMRASAKASNSGFDWQLPPGFPVPREHPDNPLTEHKVALGRHLFYDQRLSGNETQSCASCHIQALAFSDGRVKPEGSTGELHPRNSQSLANTAYNAALTWANPALTSLEQQIPVPMFGEHPIELGMTGHEAEVLARIRQDTLYRRMFALSFPRERDPINMGNIVKSLAAFLRTMISGNAPYDRFVFGGQPEALNASQQRGLQLFLSEELECHHCHGGFNFTHSSVHAKTTFVESPFHNTGLYDIDGKGSYPKGNRGIFEHTGVPSDMGKFRAPSLRNVAVTAPYMHDGSVRTLEEVIRLYEAGGRKTEQGDHVGDGRANPHKSGFVQGFVLKDGERADLLAFLDALTDEAFLTDPRFASPFLKQSDAGYIRFLEGIGWFMGTESGGVVLHHDPIPGYMGTMTMTVDRAPDLDLTGLAVGSPVSFSLVFDSEKHWVGRLTILSEGRRPIAPRPTVASTGGEGDD